MTKRYAVIGDPVGHSLSPVMHAGWIEDHHLDATYEALLLRSDDPVAAIRVLSGLAGVNVTVPHKEAAAKAADRSDDQVANTLRWEVDGTISAFNTDGLGFVDCLNESSPGWREKVETALILGAGGAANGIAHALRSDAAVDIDLVVANRTRARAEALAAGLPRTRVADWNDLESLFANADLIVQTTTLGMGGAPSPVWPVERCKPDAIVVDIVYRPLQTPLLKAARDRGLTAVDGLGMLIHQGARAFEIWFGVKPDAKKARARLLAALGETT
jgi:shikimate dehydrogenase